jgi:hypothetical protein
MGNPFDFAKPVIKFDKLDDLPKKPHTPEEVIKALQVLHKMVHAQADHYGGKNGKLLPAQIAEQSILAQLVGLSGDLQEAELDAAELVEQAAQDLVQHLGDEDLMRLGRFLSLMVPSEA